MSTCLIWTGRVSPHGYPMKGSRDRRVVLHREAYEKAKGKIPEGMHIHHICENKRCLNPDHLVALTPKEHCAAHRKPTCPNGHDFTPENTYRYDGRGRRCRQCEMEYARNKRFLARCEEWDKQQRWRPKYVRRSAR